METTENEKPLAENFVQVAVKVKGKEDDEDKTLFQECKKCGAMAKSNNGSQFLLIGGEFVDHDVNYIFCPECNILENMDGKQLYTDERDEPIDMEVYKDRSEYLNTLDGVLIEEITTDIMSKLVN